MTIFSASEYNLYKYLLKKSSYKNFPSFSYSSGNKFPIKILNDDE